MELSIKHDMERLQKELNTLGKKAFKPALNAALNREGNRARTDSIREVSKVQQIQQKLLKAKTKTLRSNFRTLTYRLDFDHRGITWGSLSPRVIGGTKRGGGRGVRAGKHKHRHAFIRNVRGGRGNTGGGSTQVLVRDTEHHNYDGRYPLRVLRVRLRKPVKIAFEKRSKEARRLLLKQLERELEFRVKREVERAK